MFKFLAEPFPAGGVLVRQEADKYLVASLSAY